MKIHDIKINWNNFKVFFLTEFHVLPIKLLKHYVNVSNFFLRAIQIKGDTFLAYFRPPIPMCHLVTLARTPSLPWRYIFHFSKYKLFLGHKQLKWEIIVQIKGKKCHVTLWSTPSLPHVSFGDAVLTPSPDIPPLSVTYYLNCSQEQLIECFREMFLFELLPDVCRQFLQTPASR